MIICTRTRLCKSLLHQDVQYSYDIHDIIYNCITARGLYVVGALGKTHHILGIINIIIQPY